MVMNWIERFLTFERLLGADLVRVTYYAGLVVILGWAILRILASLALVFSDLFAAIGLFLAVPLQALFAILLWRLLAEAAWVFFRGEEEIVIEAAPQAPDYSEGFAAEGDVNVSS
ncbi:MAG: DUF4282 domain-containing protein [Pseudomonadota bacterium]